MTTATHFAYNDTLGSKRRRAGEGGTAEGAHLTAAGAIFQLDNVHLAFPFCFANKAQAKAEALLNGGGRGVFRAVGETAAMYVWQQQAINQLTVQKNCRKLLDIYGQRTQKRGEAERKTGRTRGVP